MKQVQFLSLIGLFSFILASGCTKQQQNDQLLSSESSTMLNIATMNGKGQLLADIQVPVQEAMGNTQDRNQGNGGVSSCTANFFTAGGSEYDFAAVLNNSGIHGEWTIQHTTFGLITGETLCLSTDGNTAIVAFQVNSIEFPTSTFDVHDIVYFKSKDNGEGSNNDPDQTGNFLIIYYNWDQVVDQNGNIVWETPEAFVEDYPCSAIESLMAPLTFGNYVNIASGNIQVRD